MESWRICRLLVTQSRFDGTSLISNMAAQASGRATINVDGILNVDLSGGSRVIYVGEPTLGDIDLSGDSTVNKK